MTTVNSGEKNIEDRFWAEDPAVLYKKARLTEFIPSKEMTNSEKFNSITRFFIYSGLLLSVYKQKIFPLYLTLFGIAFTLYLHNTSKKYSLEDTKPKVAELKEPRKVKFEDKSETDRLENDDNALFYQDCQAPTKDNPFMNFMRSADDPTRWSMPPCDYEGDTDEQGVKEDTNAKFYEGLYTDIDDIYGKKHSERMYYTVPIEDRSKFQAWLYASPLTSKEGGNNLKYDDVRNQQSTYVTPQSNFDTQYSS